jgi:hypothetical protein
MQKIRIQSQPYFQYWENVLSKSEFMEMGRITGTYYLLSDTVIDNIKFSILQDYYDDSIHIVQLTEYITEL